MVVKQVSKNVVVSKNKQLVDFGSSNFILEITLFDKKNLSQNSIKYKNKTIILRT